MSTSILLDAFTSKRLIMQKNKNKILEITKKNNLKNVA